MTALLLTEKQQEAMWLRYGQKKSIDETARSLGIGRRAVLTRLRNARRRLKPMEQEITASLSAAEPRPTHIMSMRPSAADHRKVKSTESNSMVSAPASGFRVMRSTMQYQAINAIAAAMKKSEPFARVVDRGADIAALVEAEPKIAEHALVPG